MPRVDDNVQRDVALSALIHTVHSPNVAPRSAARRRPRCVPAKRLGKPWGDHATKRPHLGEGDVARCRRRRRRRRRVTADSLRDVGGDLRPLHRALAAFSAIPSATSAPRSSSAAIRRASRRFRSSSSHTPFGPGHGSAVPAWSRPASTPSAPSPSAWLSLCRSRSPDTRSLAPSSVGAAADFA